MNDPSHRLTKSEIIGLISDSFYSKDDRMQIYAEMAFGMKAFDNNFANIPEQEMQYWYYREYLPDLEIDIKEGFIQPL